MKSKIAVLLALLLTLGLSIGVVSTAQAHQGNIQVTAKQCVDTDTMQATYTVGWTNGTATGNLYTKTGLYDPNSSGWVLEKQVTGEAGSTTFTKEHSFSGANGPWISFKIVFSDDFVVGGDTRVEGWDWDKCQPDTSNQSISFCHAVQGNGESGDGYNSLTTSVFAFYTAGHVDHEGDIFPAGSFTKGGHSFSWPAQGDQDRLTTEDCSLPQAPPPVTGRETGQEEPTCVLPLNGDATYRTWTQSWSQAYVRVDGHWVLGLKVFAAKVFSDPITVSDLTCIPEKPAPVTGQDTGQTEPECALFENGSATYQTWTQNWSQEYVWDSELKSWVLGDKVFAQKVYSDLIFVEDDECRSNQPEPVTGQLTGKDEPVCVIPLQGKATVVSWTQDWSQAYVWDEDMWVLGDKVFSEKINTVKTVDSEKCAAPTPTPTVDTPSPVPSPVITPVSAPGSLPHTGGNGFLYVVLGFGLLAAGLVLLVSTLVGKRQH